MRKEGRGVERKEKGTEGSRRGMEWGRRGRERKETREERMGFERIRRPIFLPGLTPTQLQYNCQGAKT